MPAAGGSGEGSGRLRIAPQMAAAASLVRVPDDDVLALIDHFPPLGPIVTRLCARAMHVVGVCVRALFQCSLQQLIFCPCILQLSQPVGLYTAFR